MFAYYGIVYDKVLNHYYSSLIEYYGGFVRVCVCGVNTLLVRNINRKNCKQPNMDRDAVPTVYI